ncbi:MAG: hypothetical protein DRQ51_08185 [Gammaproteobacteria bacterium]|nr:MAG: hypothetical protein DRQ51_08185 [Gammaproteobacteria bacterium]
MLKIKYIFIVILASITSNVFAFDADKIKQKAQTFGKATPIDIKIYAKNRSSICDLTIKQISAPKQAGILANKIADIHIKPARYYRQDYSNIIKGTYEFEYTWSKNKQLIDSRLKTVRILSYHDASLRLYKKLNLTVFTLTPKQCK